MNTTNKTEMTEVAVAAQSAIDAMAVVTISPEKYAAEVYRPFEAKLVDAIDSVRAVNYDITTTAGMAVAVKCRALFRDMRIAADKERKTRKEPITKIGKLLESGFDHVEERITPLEEFFDADIKAEEARKEAEKAAKIAAERARVEAIQARITTIQSIPFDVVGMNAAYIKDEIDHLAEFLIDDSFDEFALDAEKAREVALKKLNDMLTSAANAEAEEVRQRVEREAAEAKAKADREELAAAQAKLKADQDKFNAEQAEASRLQKIEDDRREASIKVQQDEIAHQQAELAERVRLQALHDQHLADQAEGLAMSVTWVRATAADAAPPEFADPADTIIGLSVRPTDEEIISVVAAHFEVEKQTAYGWLLEMQQDIEYL